MATFREMSTEIQNECGGDGSNDLSTIVDDAINRAIAEYEHEAFATTYGKDTSITTVINTEEYTLPEQVKSIDGIQYRFSGTDYPLTAKTWEWYLDIISQQTSQTGPSSFYALFGRQLFLYPSPSEANTLTIWGTLRPTPAPFVAPTNDAASNFWTDERGGFQLIKARAKWDVFHNTLNDPTNAATEEKIRQSHVKNLRRRIEETMMIGRYVPRSYF